MGMTTGGKIFRGDVLLDVELPNGKRTGFLPAQNASSFAIEVPEPERMERPSFMRETAGQLLNSVSEPQPHILKITFDGFNGHLLAAAFNGALGGYSTAAKTAATVELTVGELGSGLWVGDYRISEVSVEKQNGELWDAVTASGNYTVQSRMGMVVPSVGGTLATDDVIRVTYDAAAASGDVIRGAAVSEIKARILFDGIDKVTHEDVIIEIDEVTLSGSGEFDFLAEQFNAVETAGPMITLPGKTEPYRIRFPAAAE